MRQTLLRFLGIFSIILLFIQCKTGYNQSQIVLTNDSKIDLIDKAISIQRSRFTKLGSDTRYPLLISTKGDTIPAQLDDRDGDNAWDELFFVVDLPANEKKNYALKWVPTKTAFPVRTSVRFGKRMAANKPVQPATSEVLMANELPKSIGFQRYQTDGPSWENDKVGFRHYLDGRNAKDLFGKKVSTMSPENVGINEKGQVQDTYHVMNDWGRDILAVGNTAGIGGYGLLIGDKLLRLGVTVNDSVNNIEETRFRILAEGPVHSVLNFQYKNWKSDSSMYSVDENTSIFPGMYGYQNSVKISGIKGNENLVVGLDKIDTETPAKLLEGNDKFVVLYTHDKQTYNKEWWLGLALILPRESYLGFFEAPKTGPLSNTFLAKLNIKDNTILKYYAVGCWELSDKGFADKEYFLNYLRKLTDQLSVDVNVVVN